MEWETVPQEFIHGIITKYVILYRDEKEKEIGEKDAPVSPLKVIVNGLRQSSIYSIRILAATVKGNGPASEPKYTKTDGKEKIKKHWYYKRPK